MEVIEYRDTTFWNLAGPVTFRLSSRKFQKNNLTRFPGYGGNLQNKSNKVKQIYIPDAGKIFVKRDYEGADAKIVAYLCRPGKYRSLFENNIKSHTYTAAGLFADYWKANGHNIEMLLQLPIPSLPTNPEWIALAADIKLHDKNHPRPYYYIGKKSNLSFNYEMEVNTFIGDVLKESYGAIRLSQREGKHYRDGYHKLYSEIRPWQVETGEQVRKNKILRTLQGFPRTFTSNITDDIVRKGIAFIPQSTVGIALHQASVKFYNHCRDNRLPFDIMVNEHDSLLVQCPIEREEECNTLLKNSMDVELTAPRGEKFILKSAGAAGYNWGDYHKDNNPEGMKETVI